MTKIRFTYYTEQLKLLAMKTIIKTLAILFITLLVFACKEDPLLSDIEILEKEYSDQEFYSGFTTNCYYEENTSTTVKSGKWLISSHEGSGSAAYLGNFTVDVCFCFCSEGEDCGKISDGKGYFLAETGDKLNFTFNGTILGLTSENNIGESGSLKGKFKFNGGTGVYKNASGEGVIKSEISNYVNVIRHEWAGHIQLNQNDSRKSS